MSKTAEEKLKESGIYPSDFISSSGFLGAAQAMHEFAAQEVAKEIEAYKERLKQAFENADGGDINYIIDTVK